MQCTALHANSNENAFVGLYENVKILNDIFFIMVSVQLYEDDFFPRTKETRSLFHLGNFQFCSKQQYNFPESCRKNHNIIFLKETFKSYHDLQYEAKNCQALNSLD